MGVRALLYPPFLLKTKIQVARGASEKSAFQVAKATVREEGVRGLYKVGTGVLSMVGRYGG